VKGDNVKYVLDKEKNKHELICPKCGWPLEFHKKLGRKPNSVWLCSNPLCEYHEWKIDLRIYSETFLKFDLISMSVIAEETDEDLEV